jgi:hypothetical protein
MAIQEGCTMNKMTKGIIGAAAAVILFGGGYIAEAQSNAPLVYICQGVQNGQEPNCTNHQEFEVFDRNGAPIYSVGEAGGDAVFGDNRSVFPPNSVFNPSIVESYTTPSAYGSTSCVAPALWISPTAFYSCQNGAWVKTLTP